MLNLSSCSAKHSVRSRIMTRRIMGKASFFNLQDSKGTIQIYIRRDDVGVETYNTVFKKMVDIGDIVGVKGFIFKNRTGETTLHAESFELLSKTLRPISDHDETDHGKSLLLQPARFERDYSDLYQTG